MKSAPSLSRLFPGILLGLGLLCGLPGQAAAQARAGLQDALTAYRWDFPCADPPVRFLPDGRVIDAKGTPRFNWALEAETGTLHVDSIKGKPRERAHIEIWFWPDLTGFTYHDSRGNKTGQGSRIDAVATTEGAAKPEGGNTPPAAPAPDAAAAPAGTAAPAPAAPAAPVARTAPAAPVPQMNPITELSPYILKLDGLLAITREGKPLQAFAAEAPGRLIILRQQLVAEYDHTTNDRKGMLAAAVRTTDLIGEALVERGRAVGDLDASSAVKNDGKLNAPARKDNLTQGIHGDDWSKAVGSIVERNREKQFIAQGKAQTVAGEHAMSAMAVNEWRTRAAQWHDQIAAAFSQIR